MSNAFWAPVSIRKRADGTTAVFPHFIMDRGKPGMITVDQRGKRFLNENTSYHLFGIAMQKANETTPSVPAYLVTDAEGLRKYGLGMVRPGSKGFAPFLAAGYLTQVDTLDQLAEQLGIDKAGLADSVARMNRYAQTGVDEDFQRGTTAYHNANGDANWSGPNKSSASDRSRARRSMRSGSIPAILARRPASPPIPTPSVFDREDRPIGGLYACGNDMQSGGNGRGVYPGPGITLGPGLAFAYLAARHAAARAQAKMKLDCDVLVLGSGAGVFRRRSRRRPAACP